MTLQIADAQIALASHAKARRRYRRPRATVQMAPIASRTMRSCTGGDPGNWAVLPVYGSGVVRQRACWGEG